VDKSGEKGIGVLDKPSVLRYHFLDLDAENRHILSVAVVNSTAACKVRNYIHVNLALELNLKV